LFKITAEEISIEEMIQRAKREDSGATVAFLGTVRDDGIQMMEVEAFTEAAEAELEQIRLEAIERFGLTSVQIAHRTGRLAVGESIVAIVCTAAHRAEAFDGCRYIIDELKKKSLYLEEGDRRECRAMGGTGLTIRLWAIKGIKTKHWVMATEWCSAPLLPIMAR